MISELKGSFIFYGKFPNLFSDYKSTKYRVMTLKMIVARSMQEFNPLDRKFCELNLSVK